MLIPTERITAALTAAKVTVDVRGDLPRQLSAIEDDSRRVSAGALFIAVRGTEHDGHDFLDRALERGASAAIVEDHHPSRLPAIVVNDGRRAAAVAASAAYDW